MHATRPLFAAALALPVVLAAQAGHAAAFSSGSLVVVRVGAGVDPLASLATPVFLEEYTQAGVLAQTIPMPTETSGTQAQFTLAGNGVLEGALSLSTNGQFLTLAGYAADVDTISVPGTSASEANRVVARIDAAGNVDTSTRLSNAFSVNSVRAAVTDDGTRYWVSGASNTGSANGGVHHVVHGSAGASTRILSAPNNASVVNIHDGQLYLSSTSTPFTNVSLISGGLAAVPGQTATPLPGMPVGGTPVPSPHDFVLLDRSESIPGPDLMYVADGNIALNGGGIQRWEFDGGTWTRAYTLNTNLNTGVRNLTVLPGSNPAVLYATTTDANANRLVSITDTGAGSTFTTVATAAFDTVFRGVEFSPTGGTPPCAADFDASGEVDVADIFAFLSAWFAQGPGSDFNNSGATDVADIFAFLSAWFAGCP